MRGASSLRVFLFNPESKVETAGNSREIAAAVKYHRNRAQISVLSAATIDRNYVVSRARARE
jgi:hypothetical protein